MRTINSNVLLQIDDFYRTQTWFMPYFSYEQA